MPSCKCVFEFKMTESINDDDDKYKWINVAVNQDLLIKMNMKM